MAWLWVAEASLLDRRLALLPFVRALHPLAAMIVTDADASQRPGVPTDFAAGLRSNA